MSTIHETYDNRQLASGHIVHLKRPNNGARWLLSSIDFNLKEPRLITKVWHASMFGWDKVDFETPDHAYKFAELELERLATQS